MRWAVAVGALGLLAASPLTAQAASSALAPAFADPAPDAAYPAGQDAFVLPVESGAVNALIYLASGVGPHPTLLLLHGFPGNEQNLDLAQAARRDGWNVMTMHYRGSWGSPGNFSFGSAARDAHAALAYLRTPAVAAKYHIDPARIALAGHSMGGFMAADTAADDKQVIGLFLIDAWDIHETASELGTEAGREGWHKEATGDLPPLAGTSEAALAQEMIAGGDRFSIGARIAGFGDRPLAVYGAVRGVGAAENEGYVRRAKAAGNAHVTSAIWITDHGFSDKRIALTQALLAWLDTIAPRGR